MLIREVAPHDLGAWVAMRHALWPEGPVAEHRREAEEFLAADHLEEAVLVAQGDRGLLGFVELSIRAYAEGCATDRVGYLEGWFVVREARRQGLGRALLAAAEDWARGRGCSEFGSDAEVADEPSRLAHVALGFQDMGLVRCFLKKL